MLYIALGFLLLGVLVGGAGMRRVGRIVGRTWRPGAGIVALAVFVGAAILAVRDAWAPAAVLAFLGVVLSLSVRRTAGPRHAPPAAEPAPDVKAAAAILGVSPAASEAEVQAAYHRLIQRTHPDRGGSAGLAAQLNAARDVMLKRGRPS
jgi:hypothetical protein